MSPLYPNAASRQVRKDSPRAGSQRSHLSCSMAAKSREWAMTTVKSVPDEVRPPLGEARLPAGEFGQRFVCHSSAMILPKRRRYDAEFNVLTANIE